MYTARISDEVLALAESVGAHAEVEADEPTEAPAQAETKVIKATSRRVKTK